MSEGPVVVVGWSFRWGGVGVVWIDGGCVVWVLLCVFVRYEGKKDERDGNARRPVRAHAARIDDTTASDERRGDNDNDNGKQTNPNDDEHVWYWKCLVLLGFALARSR